MTVSDAKLKVDQTWHVIVERSVGYSVYIDDERTTEYPWGWVFYFVATNVSASRRADAYAIDRLSGNSLPVGTKGLGHCLELLLAWRQSNPSRDEDERAKKGDSVDFKPN